jgi:predicted AlkP superfamily phosphohydrolase/phosphomutase
MGRSAGKVAHFYHPRQLHPGEARLRPVEPWEVDPHDYWWNVAAAAGRAVLAIDLPQTVPLPGGGATQVFEWGLHDRNFRQRSEPPELFGELRRRFGDHPVPHCDRHGEATAGYLQLLEGLLEGVNRKTALVRSLLEGRDWDLAACVYGELHCVGHQLWHCFDPSDPWHDPRAPGALRMAIPRVYERVDEGIARLIEAAGPDATVLVVASHGMGPKVGGYQLLPELLVRLGLGSGGGFAGARSLRRLQTLVSHAPRRIQPTLRRLAECSGMRLLESAAGCLLDPLESPRTRAVALPNNRCGAIRLNLAGREPHGCVAPGAEADAILDELAAELRALRDPRSGEPIVKSVVTAAEAFGPAHHPAVPDLLIDFRTDLGLVEECVSPRAGRLRVPVYHPNIPRSGDHTVSSRLWLGGPGVPAGAELTGADVLDLAPTVLERLGVPLPSWLDGRPLRLPRAQREEPAAPITSSRSQATAGALAGTTSTPEPAGASGGRPGPASTRAR